MNLLIETINNHRSIRSYKNTPISDEIITLLVTASQKAPSSINGQHVSIILIKDSEIKKQLAKACGNQHYINEAPIFFVICSDFYRAHLAASKNAVDFKITSSLEATIIGSIDVGLAMQNMINVAESLGLGTVPIGGIRNNPEKVIELLKLPQYVFPLCGLVVGYPKEITNVKPRLPLNAVLHLEEYTENQLDFIDQYDKTMSEYMIKRTYGKSSRNWTETISNYYKNDSSRDIKKAMEKQKYLNK